MARVSGRPEVSSRKSFFLQGRELPGTTRPVSEQRWSRRGWGGSTELMAPGVGQPGRLCSPAPWSSEQKLRLLTQ